MRAVGVGLALLIMAASAAEPLPPPELPKRKPQVKNKIRILNRRVQALFADDSGPDNSNSRYTTLGLRIRPELQEERDLVKQVENDGWALTQFMVKPKGKLIGPISRDGDAPDLGLDLRMLSDLGRRSMRSGRPLDEEWSGVSVDVRPILASSKSCLQCHEGKSLGDALGAMVYAYAPRAYLAASSPSR